MTRPPTGTYRVTINDYDMRNLVSRTAILAEMARIRHELSDLDNPGRSRLGPAEFVSRYKTHLKDRLAALEVALKELKDAAD